MRTIRNFVFSALFLGFIFTTIGSASFASPTLRKGSTTMLSLNQTTIEKLAEQIDKKKKTWKDIHPAVRRQVFDQTTTISDIFVTKNFIVSGDYLLHRSEVRDTKTIKGYMPARGRRLNAEHLALEKKINMKQKKKAERAAKIEARTAKIEARLQAARQLATKVANWMRESGLLKPTLQRPIELHPQYLAEQRVLARKMKAAAKAEIKAEIKANKAHAEAEVSPIVFNGDTPEERHLATLEEACAPGYLETIISNFAAKYPELQLLVAGAPGAATVNGDIAVTNRERGNALAQFNDDVVKMQRSTSYDLLPCVIFGQGAKGGFNVADSMDVHDELSIVRGSAVRINTTVAAGRYMMSAHTTVGKIINKPGVVINSSNALLYEVDDINNVDLMADVANILLDNGWITVSRGFAVKAGTDLAMEMISLSDRMFHNAIEQRGYNRSAITTPNQSEIPEGCPIFVGKLKQIGWFGNDGGCIFTNGLMKAFQDRVLKTSASESEFFNELFKGLATAHKTVARLEDDGTWMPYVYSVDDEVNAKVKAVINRLRTKTRIEMLNEATELELTAVKNIGKATAKRIVELRNRDGEFSSFDDLYERMVAEFGENKAKYVKNAAINFHRLAYSFVHDGKVHLIAMFLDEDQAKGRKTKLPEVGLLDMGSQGFEVYGWAIALDSKLGSARISLGWQVTQLLSEEFIAKLLEKDAEGARQLKGLFDNILGKKNKLFAALMEAMDDDSRSNAEKTSTAIAMMKVLGKKMSERISSGLGAKAKSAYVQMLDLGCEVVIDRVPPAKAGRKSWRRSAFFGRTPNQGHETIRKVEVLDVEFVAMTIKRFFEYKNATTGDLNLKDAFSADSGYWGNEKKQERAVKFIMDVYNKHGVEFMKVLKFVLGFLPTVAEGGILVDTSLQEIVCGDNDGDRNMISYDRLLVQIAGCITSRHPETIPAKEQSKALVVDTFADVVKEDGGVLRAYKDFLNGKKDDMRLVQLFLNAPGNSPGQDNVGGPTLTAAAPLNYHPWGWENGKFGPKNEAARRFMDYLYALQQTAIDQQKYERVIATLCYWYRAQLWKNGLICPGKPVEGKQWIVTKGKEFFGANLSEDDAKALSAANPGSKAEFCPNHYPIYGYEDMTYTEYRSLGLEGWGAAVEMVPLMTGISENRTHVKARTPMWDNTALFNFGAWTVSAINLGLDYITFEEMEALQPAFDCSGRAVVIDWQKLAEWFTTKCGRNVTADEVEANWVTPAMVSNYQKLSFNKDNSASPGVFRYMRQRTKQMYVESCSAKGIDTDYDHPINIIASSGISADIANSVDSPTQTIPYFGGWQAENVMRAMYFAYVEKASAAASNKSQSEKTQVDQVASGSEQKQFLRAALGSYSFLAIESKDLNYVRQWSRTWRNALSIGKVEPNQKQDLLAGLMVLGLRALESMAKKDASALTAGVEHALTLVKGMTVDAIESRFATWEKYKEWRDAQFTDEKIAEIMAQDGITKREAIERRELMDKAQDVLKLESVLNYIAQTGVDNIDASGLEFAAMEESEDLTLKIQDWIVGDFFGALEEAYEDIERSANRQDADHLVEYVLGEKEWGNSSTLLIQDIVRKEYWNAICEHARLHNSAGSREELLNHFEDYRAEILAEYKLFINPVIQAGRLIEYANQTVLADGWFDRAERESLFDKICYEGIYETDEDNNRQIRSSVEFPVPVDLQEQIAFATAEKGYNLELLVDVPNLGVPRRGEDMRDMSDTTVSTKKGYIYIDSAFFRLALHAKGTDAVYSWLAAQFECGVGHVTTADQLLEAYNIWAYKNGTGDFNLENETYGRKILGRDSFDFTRPYWTHATVRDGIERSDILDVQQFFMSCYSHVPVFSFNFNDTAWQARYDMLVEDTEEADALWEMEWEATKSVYMPLYYGGKSKAHTLFQGDANDTKTTPYHLYRHFGFVMAGHADAQQSKDAPQEVIEWMERTYGFPVGASKFAKKGGTGTAMSRRYSPGNAKRQAEQRSTQQRALYKKDVQNWNWDDHPEVSGFFDRYLIEPIMTKKGTLPCPMDTTVKAIRGLGYDVPEDGWKAFGHLCRLSPSLMFCMVGIVGGDTDDDNSTMLDQMKASVKNQSVSAIRQLMRDAVRARGFEMTLESVSTPVNQAWDSDTMIEILELYNK